VAAGDSPVVVARAADRDDRLDAGMCVHSRDPGGNVDVLNVAGVEAGPVRGRQVEQDQLVEVVPRQVRGGHGSPTKVLVHDDASRAAVVVAEAEAVEVEVEAEAEAGAGAGAEAAVG